MLCSKLYIDTQQTYTNNQTHKCSPTHWGQFSTFSNQGGSVALCANTFLAASLDRKDPSGKVTEA